MPATGNKSFTSYRLSIRYGADGFSFSVIGIHDGAVVQTDRFPVTDEKGAADILRQALRKPYLMDYSFQAVELVADTQETIVPLEHFSKADMLAYYRLSFPSTVNGQWSTVNGQRSMVNGQWSMVNGQRSMVNGQWSMADMQYQILTPVEAAMIFRLDQDILRTVQECYPDVKVCCTDAQLLERFAARQEQRPAPDADPQSDAHLHAEPLCDVHLHVDPRRFFIAAFRRSKLLYAASQAAAGDDDRAFLLLGIWKALDLNPQRDALHIEGASRELQKTIGEYILNISEE